MKMKHAVAMLIALVTIEVQAEFIVYHDRASFLAASGSVVVYDFESDSAAYISPPSYSGGLSGSVRDFGAFSIDATSTGIYEADIREQGENMDIHFNSYNNNVAMKVLFDDDITRFGFNYIAEGNNSYDHSTFSLLGQTWDLGTPGASGFFGVVETTGIIAAGTAFSFGQNSSNWSQLSFDNVTWSTENPTTHIVTLHPGDHGSIAEANSGEDYVVTVSHGAAFPIVTVTPDANWIFADWSPTAPATITNDFEATAAYTAITSISIHPTNVGVVNLALGTTVTPLTNLEEGSPQDVVDGDFNTIWWSYQGGVGNTISFTVDIGREVTVGRLVHLLGQAESYLIETSSNGVDWTSRHSETIYYFSAITRTHDVLGTYTARYFRYTGQNNQNAFVGVVEFQVFEMGPTLNSSAISFPTQSDWSYTLQQRTDLTSGNWTNVVGQVGVSGNGGTVTLQHNCTNATTFYRVSGAPRVTQEVGDMVQIPAGTNSGTDPDYGAYSLTVDTFYMDTTEVTKDQWDVVFSWAIAHDYEFYNNGSGKGTNHPVHTVIWYDCVRWCNARSEMAGKTPCYDLSDWSCDFSANGYRLPTSDEWEYAARGGLSGKRFPWGDTIDHSKENYYAWGEAYSYDTSSYPTRWTYHPDYDDGDYPYTSPVRSFSANGYGLHGMAGNMREWCDTRSGSSRIVRGGSYKHHADYARCGHVRAETPGYADRGYGFRAVCR